MPSSVVLITGALTGIGRAAAVAFAKAGHRVVVSGRKPDAGETLVRELRASGAEAEFVQADVRKEDDVRAMVDKTVARFGRLDVAVNNAATASPARWRRVTDEGWVAAALAIAFCISALLAKATLACTSPVLGLNTSPVRPSKSVIWPLRGRPASSSMSLISFSVAPGEAARLQVWVGAGGFAGTAACLEDVERAAGILRANGSALLVLQCTSNYPCPPERGFIPSPDEIESLITKRTRAIVVINPNNPTGTWLPPAELRGFNRRAHAAELDQLERDAAHAAALVLLDIGERVGREQHGAAFSVHLRENRLDIRYALLTITLGHQSYIVSSNRLRECGAPLVPGCVVGIGKGANGVDDGRNVSGVTAAA